MKINERVGAAVLATSVGTAVGAAVGAAITVKGWRPGRHSQARPLELEAVTGPLSIPAVMAGPPVASSVDADMPAVDAGILSVDGDISVEEAETSATDQADTARAPRMVRLSAIASAVSFMALGGLIVILVLWAAGTFATASEGTVVADSGDALPVTSPQDPSRPDLPRTAADVVPAQAEAQDAEPDPVAAQLPDPQRIEIPAVGIDAVVIPLGVQDDGALEVPEDFAQTGWWTGGPEPGEDGGSVLVGHVDSYQGPAVFFRLKDLVYDDTIIVTRGDGSSAVFAVRSAVKVDKEAFPTDLVYGPTDDRVLRLITCDGDFADGSYLGNLIVTAELLEELPAPDAGLTY